MADDRAASRRVRCTLVNQGPRNSIEGGIRGHVAAGSRGGDPVEVKRIIVHMTESDIRTRILCLLQQEEGHEFKTKPTNFRSSLEGRESIG